MSEIKESLDKRIYNSLREDIKDISFLSSGFKATGFTIENNLNEIYEKIKFFKEDSFVLEKTNEPLENQIDGFNPNSFYTRYKDEYGFSIKNHFSLKDAITNLSNPIEVDIATTQQINLETISNQQRLIIDGIVVEEGQKILVKDQTSNITLDENQDPTEFIQGNFTIVETIGSSITYSFKNSENGIYIYNQGNLTETQDLENYQFNNGLSISISIGDDNKGKTFILNRLNNGVYPLKTKNEVFDFVESKSYLVRNVFQYRNVLDNQFHQGLHQKQQNLVFQGENYNIPERYLFIGDYGVIINYQSDYPNLIENKFKESLKDIIELKNDYLIVGNNGTILKLDKINLNPSKISTDTFQNLNSVSIRDFSSGVIVGDNGTILKTINGIDFIEVKNNLKNDLNKVIHKEGNIFKIVGNNGLIYNFNIETNKLTSKEVSYIEDFVDDYPVKSDIFDIENIELNKKRFSFFEEDYLDVSKTIGTGNFSIDFVFKTQSENSNQSLLSFLPKDQNLEEIGKGVRIFIEESIIKLEITPSTGSGIITLSSEFQVEKDKWYSVFLTRNKGEYFLYVDSILAIKTQKGFGGNFSNFNDRIRLGTEIIYNNNKSKPTNDIFQNNFEGVIDNLRIWNEFKSKTEVNRYFNFYQLSQSQKQEFIQGGLINFYKFSLNSKGRLPTKDEISGEELILGPESNYRIYNSALQEDLLDIENYSGDIIISSDFIIIQLDNIDNYSKVVNYDFIYKTPQKLDKVEVSNSEIIISSKQNGIYRFGKKDVILDLNDFSNLREVILTELHPEPYNNILLSNGDLFLIGNLETREIKELNLSEIPTKKEYNPIEDVPPFLSLSNIRNENGLEVENQYKNDFIDPKNDVTLKYVKVLGIDDSDQSVVEIPLEKNGDEISPFRPFLIKLEASNIFNGSLQISINEEDFFSVTKQGTYLFEGVMGSKSKMTIRAKLSDDAYGNKIRGVISNIKLYDKNLVEVSEPKQYTESDGLRKLYFSQFDDNERLNKVNQQDHLYSYLDIKSLRIDGEEKINFQKYNQNLPKYLFKNQLPTDATSNCLTGNLCKQDPNGKTFDRIRYGFDLELNENFDEYTYKNESYGLLESFNFDSVQIFGLDKSQISSQFETIQNPLFLGIDLSKSFFFDVESVIINQSDLAFDDIGSETQSVLISGGVVNYPPLESGLFNNIRFNDVTNSTFQIQTNLEKDKIYRLEFFLEGDVRLIFGNEILEFSNEVVREKIRIKSNLTEFTIVNLSPEVNIRNLVLTENISSTTQIRWEPSTCRLEYLINGKNSEDGFLLEDGSGKITPKCELIEDPNLEKTTKDILPNSYWQRFNPKLLFLDYDLASKLYFYDLKTKQYQLPNSVVIQDLSKFTISSLPNQVSWLDYSKDATKEYKYRTLREDSNEVKYSSEFMKDSKSKIQVKLKDSSTKNLNNINGVNEGILTHLDNNLNFGIPPSAQSFDFFFYQEFLVFKKPQDLSIEIGDFLNFHNSLINSSFMVMDKLKHGNSDLIYCKPHFSENDVNSLLSLNKDTTITNLNLFEDTLDLEENFNNHPISFGYQLSLKGSSVEISGKLTEKSAYYNLQFQLFKENSLLDIETFQSTYNRNFLNFKYTPYYSILNYLEDFNSNFKLRSLPEYTFENNNSGVLYDITTGEISFNRNLEKSWSSIPKNVFIDLEFKNQSLKEILILDKFFDEKTNRYVLQTYKNFSNLYVQNDLSGDEFKLRVRNTLGEVSKDLQKLNNIHKSLETNTQITDPFNKDLIESSVFKKGLNFSPNNDNYAKSLLSEGAIKERLSGLVFTDSNNSLSFSVLSLSTKENYVINGIDSYPIDCDNCIYQPVIEFENEDDKFNQLRYINEKELFSKRKPFSKYGFENQIRIENSVGNRKTINIPFGSKEGTIKTLEFSIKKLENAVVKVSKSNQVFYTISTTPNKEVKVNFYDDAVQSLELIIEHEPEENFVIIEDIKIGNEKCIEDCNLTKLQINNHGLEGNQKQGLILDIEEDIFQLDTIYKSDFEIVKDQNSIQSATSSGWILNGEDVVGIEDGKIDLNYEDGDELLLETQVEVDPFETHRIEFDYQLSTTFSDSVSIIKKQQNSTDVIDFIDPNGSFERIETNFIPQNNLISIGLKFQGVGNIKINNIVISKLTNKGKYYNGYNVIEEILDKDHIVIDREFIGRIEELTETFTTVNKCGQEKIQIRTISNIGTASKVKFDPYFNYAPIDLYEVNTNNEPDKAVQIETEDWNLNDNQTLSLKPDFNFEEYRYRLVDGLSILELNNRFSWILNSDIRKAVIGKDSEGIIWYKGIFDNGRFFNGKWLSGVFRSGNMFNSKWFNNSVKEVNGEIEITNNNPTNTQSFFYGGEFQNGQWNGGEFLGGDIHNSEWNGGVFSGNSLTDVIWNQGELLKGDWISGTFNDGVFSASLGDSNWFFGDFLGGEFRNGNWFNGRFESKNKISQFGTNPNLTRKSIWKNGIFIDGYFNSGNNQSNKLSIWELGQLSGGFFRGGEIYGGSINNCSITNTEINDIEVKAFVGSLINESFFTLKGRWNFKINDEFYIINNNSYNPIFGSNNNPIEYRVKRDSIIDGDQTRLIVEEIPSEIVNLIGPTKEIAFGYKDNDNPNKNEITEKTLTKIVPLLQQVDFFNGQINNGLFTGNFRSGVFKGGIYSKGNFGF